MSYGTDTWCTDSLVVGRLATGTNIVVQALYRRLITPRGKLRGGPEEDAYGLDVSAYVGAVGTAASVAILPGLVRSEFMKDDRVVDVSVVSSFATDTAGLTTITLSIDVLLEDESEPFSFTVGVSEVTTELLGVAA